MDQLAVFRTILLAVKWTKGGLIHARFHRTQASSFSRCNCSVLLQLFGILRFFCDIKSDKNHQLQSKSHRNNNDKNSICKRIIIWYKFLLCCGNTVLHMFQSEWHYDKFIVSKLFVKIIFENDLKTLTLDNFYLLASSLLLWKLFVCCCWYCFTFMSCWLILLRKLPQSKYWE